MTSESKIAGTSTDGAIIDTVAAIQSDQEKPDETSNEIDQIITEGAAASSSEPAKKKKKSKAKQVLRKLKGKEKENDADVLVEDEEDEDEDEDNGKQEIPDEVLHKVLEKVREQGTVNPEDLTTENVKSALEQMKIMDVVKGRAGIGGKNAKDMGKHKVCN